MELDLQTCTYEFLVALLSFRASLSTENKTAILMELNRRNCSEGKAVTEPH